LDPAERIRIFTKSLLSNHQLDELASYIADTCVVRIGEQLIPVGVEGMKQHMIDVRKTYPDLKMTITRQFVCGNTVISEFIMEGTFLGELARHETDRQKKSR
jgi:hypothetical protein